MSPIYTREQLGKCNQVNTNNHFMKLHSRYKHTVAYWGHNSTKFNAWVKSKHCQGFGKVTFRNKHMEAYRGYNTTKFNKWVNIWCRI